ncbi:dihydroorotate dehydrogenase-like protein [Maribellus sp. YY47]|uniref:dihydroorotate dehydrogenase-like protein n=1 Tax=Maribellus sp. YY47 TaxID=2929486 RepID=UPI002000ECFF|nr:dihydroorotate dehydrogenase-like protein [Maribellus sp. YY47]MCK3683364.1 dihydroorotate dehydrogenase-like protein [Maribellus sp. YY47]
MANFETTYLGLKLKNPIVAASSGLTSSVEKIKELAEAGIGAIVLKSIFEEQINNEVTNMLSKDQQNTSYPEAEDYIKNYLRDNTVTKHLELVKKAKEAVDVPIIASINCVSSAEWTSFAKDFQEAGADAIELNIFYLPTDRNEKPGMVEQLYIDVLNKVKQEVSIPVSVKFGLHHSNIIGMADKLKANGAAGIVMFNRFYEPDINLDTLELTASEVFSSPADIRRSLRWVGIVSSAVSKLDIAASTGIHDGDAVIKQLLAGAKVAQICSSLYVNGSGVVPKMVDDITAFMKKWNFKTIEDFRGRLSYKNIPDPLMYERSQFMKYFSNKK